MSVDAVEAGSAQVDPAGRLELARGLLRRMEGRGAARPAPVPGAGARLLPVVEPLARLLPSGGLRRGSTVAVGAGPGATSLLLALLAAASADGAWAGVIGYPGLGLVAAAEAGVRLERLALVPHPGADLVVVTAALLDGVDLVAVGGVSGVRAADRQRLAARARQRGSVLLASGPWPGADVELSCSRGRWRGLSGGAGRLCARPVRVRLRGRGIAPSGHEAAMLLPAPGGGVGPVSAGAASVPGLRGVG